MSCCGNRETNKQTEIHSDDVENNNVVAAAKSIYISNPNNMTIYGCGFTNKATSALRLCKPGSAVHMVRGSLLLSVIS